MNIAKDVDLLNSKIWSSQIKEGVFAYEAVSHKGAGAQELVDFTYYKGKMGTVDDFVADRVSKWPTLAAYKGVITNPNPFGMHYLLNLLQARKDDESVSTISSARFMGAVNAVWCLTEEAPFIYIKEVCPLIADFAWEIIFATQPDGQHIAFTDEFYRVNFVAFVQGSALQNWDGNWDSIATNNRRMAAYLGVAANLMMNHLSLQICEWHFVSTHLACLAFISLKGMTPKKWESLRAEIAASARSIALSAANEVKDLGPDIQSFLIKAGSYVSTFIALGQRTCSQTLHIYLSKHILVRCWPGWWRCR